MSNLPCDIEISIFGSAVVRKCRTCGVVSTIGNTVPCKIHYETEIATLETAIKNLKLELFGDNEPTTAVQLVSKEHEKLKNILGVK